MIGKIIDKLKRFALFTRMLGKYFFAEGLYHMANSLTYRLILGIFPFLIFCMSLIGFFNIDGTHLLVTFYGYLPDAVFNILEIFVSEVIYSRNISYMSVSLLVCIFTSSSGFIPIIDGINRAYKLKYKRNTIIKRGICLVATLVFALIMLLAAVLIVFRDQIIMLILRYIPQTDFSAVLFAYIGYGVSLLIIFIAIILIYRICLQKKEKLTSFIPGSLFTVIVWTLISRVFNLYINNFANISVIYGSIAGIFILMYWLNLLSVSILFGACLNAKLAERRERVGE